MTDPTDAFDSILAEAREIEGWTDAELDYHLSLGHEQALRAIDMATYLVANPDGGDIDTAGLDRSRALRDQVQADYDAHVEHAKARRYLGWSDAARSRGHRIRYAEEGQS